MFAHALPQGSLRPAEVLPPTLTPNAVLAMAPPAPRRVGFLGACVVYSLCGAGLLVTPAVKEQLTKPRTVSLIINDTPNSVVVPEQVRPAAPPPPAGIALRTAPPRPADWAPPIDSNVVPPTPTSVPTKDLSMSTARPPQPEDLLRPVNQLPGGLPEGHGTAPSIVEISCSQIRVLQQVTPSYPALPRLAKIQGDVVLLMTVDPRGVPSEVRALSGPHPSLEQEAMRVARLWRFEPATMNGQPVSAQFRLTIQFRLK